jgi:hypothetical protein
MDADLSVEEKRAKREEVARQRREEYHSKPQVRENKRRKALERYYKLKGTPENTDWEEKNRERALARYYLLRA